MADTVRYMMEEMVPELEDFAKQKYFSKQEIKQIVKRRQDFEYLLKRKAALKEDYFRYIEYESKLEELRQHRKAALAEKGKKKTLADYAIIRRIHFIFERAVRKFRSDLSIWTSWLEFCRASNSNCRLGRVVGRALQIHPTEPGLWVYAAAWEFEHNQNPAAARALMQQGLRMCKYSEKMWLDYFDMELMYVEKLIARCRILGLDIPDAQQQPAAAVAGQKRQQPETDSQQQQQQQGASSSSDLQDAADDGEGPESAAEAAAAAAEAPKNYLQQQQQQSPDDQAGGHDGPDSSSGLDPQAAVNAVLSGAVAKLVFHNAVKAAAEKKAVNSSSNFLDTKAAAAAAAAAAVSSGGLGFRAGFLQVLGKYSSPGVAALRQEVLDSISKDYPRDPAAADLLARSSCNPSDLTVSQEDVQSAVQYYEQLIRGGTLEDVGSTMHTPAAAEMDNASGSRQAKRRKGQQQQQGEAVADTPEAVQLLSHEAAVQLYRLYSAFLSERLNALLDNADKAMDAAAAAQQLFKLYVRAHETAAADVELYQQWVELASRLKQNKVALKAARLACEANPTNANAWQMRVQLEAAAAAQGDDASSSSSHGKLLSVIKEGLKRVPVAEAGKLWEQAFDLCSNNASELQELQQLLLAAVTAAAVKGPATGGLGATVGHCLRVTWSVQGAEAARKLYKKLLLLPPAGGDMFGTMVDLESAAAAGDDDKQQQQQQQRRRLGEDAIKRVRAVYDSWVAAYGGCDAELWVRYALFEQGNNNQGSGRVYWRAVKELEDPDEFIQMYRSKVGLL